MANTASYAPRSSGLLRRAIRLAIVFLALCWIVQAGQLFLGADFYPYHENLARFWLAGRDSLYGLPKTIAFVFSFVWGLITSLYAELGRQLGHDPITLPEVGVPSLSSDSGFSDTDALVAYASKVGLGFSVGQFIVMFFIMGFGGAVGWRRPGLPVVFQGPAMLVYWLLCALMGAGLIYVTVLHASSFYMVTVAVVIVVCILFPLVGLLPLWFLEKILKVHPRTVLGVFIAPFCAGQGDRGHGHGHRRSREEKGQRSSGKADSEGQESRRQYNRSGHVPKDSVEQKYASACATFELTPRQFTQQELRTRWRTLESDDIRLIHILR